MCRKKSQNVAVTVIATVKIVEVTVKSYSQVSQNVAVTVTSYSQKYLKWL